MNVENAKQALEWFSELPDERHNQNRYFSHCGPSSYDGTVPEDALMCFGGMIIYKAKLKVKKERTIEGWSPFLIAVSKWLGVSYVEANIITSVATRRCVVEAVQAMIDEELTKQ